MELIEKKDNQIIFKTKIEESLANAMRRYIHQVPVLAIEELEISKNDSPLYDETVAHRIGLIPLKMQKSFNNKTEVKFKLKTKKEGNVYSGELKGDTDVVYDNIPITFLNKGQELELKASAKIGKGTEHSKFSPGLMFYRNIVDIKVDKDCPQEVVEKCPQGIFEIQSGKIGVKDKEKCDMCEACTDFCKKKGKNSIKIISQEELMLTIESFGQMKTGDVLKSSIDVLKKDLDAVSKKLK